MSVVEQIDEARASGRAVRLHTRDGEVLVAHVLDIDEVRVRYVVVTSSRPENYAVCDSTGFLLDLDDIERAQLLGRA